LRLCSHYSTRFMTRTRAVSWVLLNSSYGSFVTASWWSAHSHRECLCSTLLRYVRLLNDNEAHRFNSELKKSISVAQSRDVLGAPSQDWSASSPIRPEHAHGRCLTEVLGIIRLHGLARRCPLSHRRGDKGPPPVVVDSRFARLPSWMERMRPPAWPKSSAASS
jgi:hypothetical protein